MTVHTGKTLTVAARKQPPMLAADELQGDGVVVRRQDLSESSTDTDTDTEGEGDEEEAKPDAARPVEHKAEVGAQAQVRAEADAEAEAADDAEAAEEVLAEGLVEYANLLDADFSGHDPLEPIPFSSSSSALQLPGWKKETDALTRLFFDAQKQQLSLTMQNTQKISEVTHEISEMKTMLLDLGRGFQAVTSSFNTRLNQNTTAINEHRVELSQNTTAINEQRSELIQNTTALQAQRVELLGLNQKVTSLMQGSGQLQAALGELSHGQHVQEGQIDHVLTMNMGSDLCVILEFLAAYGMDTSTGFICAFPILDIPTHARDAPTNTAHVFVCIPLLVLALQRFLPEFSKRSSIRLGTIVKLFQKLDTVVAGPQSIKRAVSILPVRPYASKKNDDMFLVFEMNYFIRLLQRVTASHHARFAPVDDALLFKRWEATPRTMFTQACPPGAVKIVWGSPCSASVTALPEVLLWVAKLKPRVVGAAAADASSSSSSSSSDGAGVAAVDAVERDVHFCGLTRLSRDLFSAQQERKRAVGEDEENAARQKKKPAPKRKRPTGSTAAKRSNNQRAGGDDDEGEGSVGSPQSHSTSADEHDGSDDEESSH